MAFLRNLTVNMKVGFSFSIVLAMLLLISFISYYKVADIYGGFHEYRRLARDTNLAGRLQANMLMVRMNVKDFLITGSEKDVKEYQGYLKKMTGFLEEANREIKQPERAKIITNIDQQVVDYEKNFSTVVAMRANRDTLVNEQLNPTGLTIRQDLTEIMKTAYRDKDNSAAYHAGRMQEHILLARLYVVKFLNTNQKSDSDRALKELNNAKGYAAILDKDLQNRTRRRLLADAKSKMAIYEKTFTDLTRLIFSRNQIISGQLDRIGPVIAKEAEKVKLSVKADQDALGPVVQALAEDTKRNILYLSIGAAVTSVLLTIFLIGAIKNLTAVMVKLVNDLFGASDQLASASSEISSSAQQLSSGASEQAASLEETSSTMEEVSSQARDNATSSQHAASSVHEMNELVSESGKSAKSAADLAQKTRKTSKEGVESMTKIAQSMTDINQASNQVTDIIEVINEITHQTKMLATNAAIEAARAGEQGKGFAVVADEVSKLAESSKSAAKEIAHLVHGAAEKAKAGNQLAEGGQKVLQEINDVAEAVAGLIEDIAGNARTQVTTMTEVKQLVDNITEASKEQANGVDQISTALVEMDEVTQVNASTSEESASAAEELNSQAEALREMVEDVAKHFGVKRSSSQSSPDEGTPRVVRHLETKPLKTPRATIPAGVLPANSAQIQSEFSEF